MHLLITIAYDRLRKSLAKTPHALHYIYGNINSNTLYKMDFTGATLSERPAYDAEMVDFVFSTYCTVDAVKKEKKVTTRRVGIDVAKRKSAILKSLAIVKVPQIFGEVELDMYKHSHE
jgi:hypothetical protein